jgi:diaminopimelate decarboxylase
MSHVDHAVQLGFPIVNGELIVGGLPVSLLAARVGRTPFYAYDRRLIDERVALLRRVLPAGIELHYAIKANPMPAVVDFLATRVDGMDVASGAELRIVLDAGVIPAEVSFAGPGKSDAELQQAVASGVLLNVESMREIQALEAASARIGRPARVAVRVNPGFELKSSGMKMGGGPKPFGIDAEAVQVALAAIGRYGLSFEGFHIFCGSQNLRHEAICDAQTQAVELAIRLAEDAPGPVRRLNLGGGFGIPYFPGDKPLDLYPIAEHLQQIVDTVRARLPGARPILELGRYLVGEAGVYVARVVDRKVSRGEVFLVTDGGLHHHLAASGNFGQVIRKNYPVTIGTRASATQHEVVSVVGPLCTPLDIIADRMALPTAAPGDLVVVFQSGAYGLTASPLGFLSHPTPLEVLV